MVFPQDKFLLISSLSFECLFLPIQTNLILSVFTFKPDMLPNISMAFNAANKDSLHPFNTSVVSSANCVNFMLKKFGHLHIDVGR